MLSAAEIYSQLNNFKGTENYYKYGKLHYTDGIKFLADSAECYWLLDAIASYQRKLCTNPKLRDFQLWLLVRSGHEFIKPTRDNDAVLTCWQDTPKLGVNPEVSQQIPFTDFPLPEIKLYFEHGVLLLPSEH